jgi:hypothetical protein
MLLRHAAALKVRTPGRHRPMHRYERVLLLTKSPGTTSIDRHCASGLLMVARAGRDIWTIRPSGEKGDHSATFPIELATNAFSPVRHRARGSRSLRRNGG